MNFSPTPEQQAALKAFATGENMVIEAGAGTGKTSTLRLLAESTDRKGIYLAYNKAIQVEAEKDFPANVECRTAHSLAYRAMMRTPMGSRMRTMNKTSRVSSKQAASLLGIPSGGFQVDGDKNLPAWAVARAAMDTVSRFCNSDSDEITRYHVPLIEGIEDQDALRTYILPFARKAWEDLSKPVGQLKFTHDCYLKLWALTNPKLGVDFILFDEAQDANPVIAKIVTSQACQQVMVGDSCQAIYGWRGAVDAMSSFETKHRTQLSQSFRFGQAVADQANKFLGLLNAPLRLSGFEKVQSVVGFLQDPDAILCRTNAGVLNHAMEAQQSGKKVAIVGGTQEIKNFAFAAISLMKSERTDHPELSGFENWQEVCEYTKGDEGADLRMMVGIINNYGASAVIEVANNSVDEKNADIVVSTAHKAKGREWNKVRIGSDFKAPEEGILPSRPELMLAYVAVTRAKVGLDHGNLAWIDGVGEGQ